MVGGQRRCASAISSAGAGFSKRSTMLAALTLTRLPVSSSTWAEASASDRTRPPRYLPASSNNTNMAQDCPMRPGRRRGGRGLRRGRGRPTTSSQVRRLEIRQRMVAAFEQLDAAAAGSGPSSRASRALRRPWRRSRSSAPGGAAAAHVERAQLVDVLGLEIEVLGRVVPGRLVADVACQVARRVHGGVQQHRAAAGLRGHLGGVEAAQRRADHGHAGARPAGDARASPCSIASRGEGGSCGHHHCTPGWWRATKSRHQPRLGRLGRGAKTVEVEQVGGGGMARPSDRRRPRG